MTIDEELVEFLGQYVSENKHDKIAAALAERTRHVTVLLEEIFQPHNASACLRSCDCLGFQDVHIVEKRNTYQPNTNISLGSSKWLTLNRYDEVKAAANSLRARGYRLVATSPNYDGYTPTSLPLDQPIALMFGTEEVGLTDAAIELADDYLCLPMYGFTQSFNISVCLAITLSRIAERLRAELDDSIWHLSSSEQSQLKLDWFRSIVKRPELLEDEFRRRQSID